tara:strand:- start:3552 stop:4493 length:942 start_codon:yes stop_codon:yes gene_type:complete
MIKKAFFYSKILLFGEYGIIKDSMGLSVPYTSYQGELKMDMDNPVKAKESNLHLRNYLEHLEQLDQNGELEVPLDLKAFRKDVEAGISFDSTIPQGFGVGSSGALVAAVYDKYALDKIDAEATPVSKDQIVQLKKYFGLMEKYFHGTSSGIDPLICYLKLPLLIRSKEDLESIGLPDYSNGEGAIFLLNSGQPGETQPMINIFMEKMKHDGFRNMLRSEFKKYNDACIQAFIDRDISPLFTNLKELSKLVLDNFKPMIPSVFHNLWKQGIDTNAYYLKLCGSGGGGFILGFTKDLNKAKELLKDHDLEVIYRF